MQRESKSNIGLAPHRAACPCAAAPAATPRPMARPCEAVGLRTTALRHGWAGAYVNERAIGELVFGLSFSAAALGLSEARWVPKARRRPTGAGVYMAAR